MSHGRTQSERRPPRELPVIGSGGRRPQDPPQWQSVEELEGRAAPPGAEELAGGLSDGVDALTRRRFLELTAATAALAGAGCFRAPDAEILPYAHLPEDVVPGRPAHYATTLLRSGYGRGALVESHMGRPTKVEGNPDHPASLGSSDVFLQADVLTLYDPDRSQAVREGSAVSTWERFAARLRDWLAEDAERGASRLAVLTGYTTSPTEQRLLRKLLAERPGSRWFVHEPVGRERTWEGARLAFGRPLEPVYRLEEADVLLSLDSDVLSAAPGALAYARGFAARRRVRTHGEDAPARMNRLYAVEPSPTVTGAKADHALPLAPPELERFALALAARLGVPGAPPPGEAPAPASPEARRWLGPVARDLLQHRGRALVLAGESLPPRLHALVHAINAYLEAVGRTVRFVEPPTATGDPDLRPGRLEDLARALRTGEVDAVVMAGVNPAYTAPADLRFSEALAEASLCVHLGLFRDETARRCHWHLPQAHPLESWGDARAFDGTASVIQPLIAPLYAGRSALHLLALLAGRAELTDHDLVRETWQPGAGEGFERWWRGALHAGVVPGSAFAPVDAALQEDAAAAAFADAPPAREEGELVLCLRPDPTVWDGRYANNGWLQETPKPINTLTWDNALLVSPHDAARLGLETMQVAALEAGEARVEGPVLVQPGQAEGVISLTLGYGRWAAGRLADDLGVNAYRLRTTEAAWVRAGVRLRPTDERYRLAIVQRHHRMEGRHLVRHGDLETFRRDPKEIVAKHHDTLHVERTGHRAPYPPPSLHPERDAPAPQWGMGIDLTACIGCNACVTACVAENVIPVVGKEQTALGRHMHWILVDVYYTGPKERPEVHRQPRPCMHCEHAPCEVVCPTGATQHSGDGLNEMIYNRCVGTRYCSNNCPYKVRRFNFLHYVREQPRVLRLQRNPQVTVRTRGVMEKCTYCVQRIRTSQIAARREGRELSDGEVTPACAQACPTEAIVFGDVADPDAEVSRWKREPHDYHLLGELNTRPRTSYLAEIRNPNRQLERHA